MNAHKIETCAQQRGTVQEIVVYTGPGVAHQQWILALTSRVSRAIIFLGKAYFAYFVLT